MCTIPRTPICGFHDVAILEIRESERKHFPKTHSGEISEFHLRGIMWHGLADLNSSCGETRVVPALARSRRISLFSSGTSLSERLQRDRSDSLYWLSMLYGDEWQLRAWERLEDSIRTGRSGMSCAFGIDLWTYLDQHPDSAELYNKALSGLSALNDQVAKAYEFPESAVVIDIGGGQGDFLRRILARNSTVRGVLFDRK